ncbi:MAG: hypothetical protein IT469_05565, partial [Pseudomonadales bacterium]|nr:hypothetical protein [Pseudomonadales bacterium]
YDTMKKQKPFTMFVVSHTHWDREWYQAFQGYRRRLVFQIDAMMDLLERRKSFRFFHLDGQTSVLCDYVEIKPQNRARLARHLASGRVLVGPWFTMPDECHLSGESLIRNLQLGHRHCGEWGTKPMPIGWVSDVFSHISQMPQILAGFGLDSAFIHHGTPCTEGEQTEMVWEGADGTVTLMLKAHPWFGYQDVLQMRYRSADEIRHYERRKLGLASTKILLGLDGNDHEPAKWDTPEVIERMNGMFEQTHAVHASLPEYLAALRKALGKDWARGRQRFVSELRVPSKTGNWNGLTNGTGSSRLPLKQANDAQEILLGRLAEPLNAWASLVGGEPQRNYLDRAWQYLFLNHPHDSICGCSIDQAHRDMVYRFDQCRLLAGDSLDDSAQAVIGCIDPAPFRAADAIVTVFNAGIAPTGPVTRLAFELPAKLVAEKAAQGLAPVLLDDAGRPVACDVIQVERAVRPAPLTYKEPGYTPAISVRREHAVDRFHVALADAVPALGYRTWRIAYRAATGKVPRAKRPRVKADAARGVLENECVRLVARPDGRIDLYDKGTRTWYRGIHEFEDCGDMGDGWNHIYPTKDVVVRSTDARARGKVRVALVQVSSLTASLKVSLTLRVPADLVTTVAVSNQRKTETTRSRETVVLPIETVFTLHAGSRRVDCRTTVNNTARCHRLRAIFPTNRRTDAWYGDTAFDLVKRPVKLRATEGWNEHDREECPIKNIVAACDRRAGLAVLTKGLYEAAVQDKADRPIALTLFRGFVEHLFFEKTRDSLLLGELIMEYALLPFSPERGAPPVSVHGDIDRYKLPLPAYTRPATGEAVAATALPPYSESNPPQPAPSVGTEVITPSPELKAIMRARPQAPRNLPPTGTLLSVSAPLAVSTIKTAEQGRAVIVRVWNPTGRAVTGELRATFGFKRAALTDLLEQPTQRLAVRGRAVRFAAGPKKILTIRLDR